MKTRRTAPLSFENWIFWWRYNRDDILNLRDRPLPDGTQVSRECVERQIVPALQRAISPDETSTEVRGAALVALARARPDDLPPGLFLAHCPIDDTGDPLVRQSAILAIGIASVRGKAVRDHLLAILGKGDRRFRERAKVILALGLLRDDGEDVWRALTPWMEGRSRWLDTAVCAWFSIGLIGDPKRVPALLEAMESRRIGNEKLGDLEIAWLIDALARIGDPAAAEPIAARLRGKGRLAARSAAIALGSLVPRTGPSEQLILVERLAVTVKRGRDFTTRALGKISLGRIIASPATTDRARRRAQETLLEAYRNSSTVMERPWAALGIALGRVRRASPLLRADLAASPLDPDSHGALALALGILGDSASTPLIRGILADRSRDNRLRRRAALALGLLGDRRSIPVVLEALRATRDGALLVDAATAARLLGAGEAVDHLLHVVGDRKSPQYLVQSAIRALGTLGDRSAIEPLVGIVNARELPEATRSCSVTALGHLADGRRHRALFRLTRDMNYRAAVPVLDEILRLE